MATTSRIPAAIDALVVTLTAAVGATTNVVDGPPLSWDAVEAPGDAVSETSWLFVGASPDGDEGATSTQEFNAAGAVSRDEMIEIHCTAYVWGGDQVIKTRRDDAAALVAQVEQAIRADSSLGAAVLYSKKSGDSYRPSQNENGSDCTWMFTVTCRAYLT